jgi:hypothetical protein
VNAISALISAAQVVLIWFALRLMRLRSGDQATKDLIAGTEAVAAAART